MKKWGIPDYIAMFFIVIFSLSLLGVTYLKYWSGDNKSNHNNNDNTKDNNQVDTSKGVTLQQIVDKFNTSTTIKSYNDAGSDIKAKVNGNAIVIDTKDKKNAYTIPLNGDILSLATTSNEDISGALFFTIIVDSIQQLHGVKAEESFKTLNSDEVKNYTLVKDNVEIKQISTGFDMKVNINKKMTLIDSTNVYIMPSDLEQHAEFIKGDGGANFSKGNLMFLKNGYDDEAVVTIYEENKLTANAYKSIISTLTVIFNEATATKFSKEYPSLSSGNKTFGAYKVELNPALDAIEMPKSGNYKWVRITIDKAKV